MTSKQIRVNIFSCPPRDNTLEFRIIFDDGYEKYYNLTEYDIAYYRGARELDIIEHLAREYYEMLGQKVDRISIMVF